MLISLAQRVASGLLLAATMALPAAPAPGLAVTVTSGGQSHSYRLPTVALYVQAGHTPSPFVPEGAFTAVWDGSVQAELRGSFRFQAELAGSLKLEVNGRTILEAIGTNASPPFNSAPVQLSKGSNTLRATFTSAPKGDSFVRLGWAERGTNFSPIPENVLRHVVSPAQSLDEQLANGRDLFLEYRCLNCHATTRQAAGSTPPEQAMDSPTLEGIGSRRHHDWMNRWISNPRGFQPTARMPKLRGATAPENATAIAAFLGTLSGPAEKPSPARAPIYQTRQGPTGKGPGPSDPASAARPLYARLHCGACHGAPDASEVDPAKLSHSDLAAKFPQGQLADYLVAPEAGYAWTRMPNFHLTAAEARELEDYLLRDKGTPRPESIPADPTSIEKGRQLVQSTGCLNCHALNLENKFKAPRLNAWAARTVPAAPPTSPAGCLGSDPVVDFGLSAEQKTALTRFIQEGLESLRRHVPAEFAERHSRLLNCAACHGQLDLVPRMELLGGKLKPEWSRRFMAGEIPHKIRFDQHPNGEPWVEARMPAFKSRATDLARGLAARHGVAPVTPTEAAVDPVAAESGRKLVGKSAGFSCVACHAIGPRPALEVFESEGINLAWSADRLLPSYYQRWFRNPLSIEPQTKMPVYFDDEGASPLTDVLDGNGDAQINAVWHYLRLGDKMAAPE